MTSPIPGAFGRDDNAIPALGGFAADGTALSLELEPGSAPGLGKLPGSSDGGGTTGLSILAADEIELSDDTRVEIAVPGALAIMVSVPSDAPAEVRIGAETDGAGIPLPAGVFTALNVAGLWAWTEPGATFKIHYLAIGKGV